MNSADKEANTILLFQLDGTYLPIFPWGWPENLAEMSEDEFHQVETRESC